MTTHEPSMPRKQTGSDLIVLVSAACAGTALFLIDALGFLPSVWAFWALTLLLLLFLMVKGLRIRRQYPGRWLLHPALFSSVFILGIPFGLSNVLYLLPDSQLNMTGFDSGIRPEMVKTLWLVLIAAIALWAGFSSSVSNFLVGRSLREKIDRTLLRMNRPRAMIIPLFFGISVLARLVSIYLGIFGYAQDALQIQRHASVSMYLSILVSLGQVALVLAASQYYMSQALKSRSWMITILATEILFGLISGMKSAMVMPIVIVGACYYLVRRKLPMRLIWASVLALVVAYGIIEPFRLAWRSDTSFKSSSVADIVDAMRIGQTQFSGNENRAPVYVSILVRSNLTSVASFGVALKDESGPLPEDSPQFLRNIMLSPVYALIPRFLWSGKPMGDVGAWYTMMINGTNYANSSTAMSAITYLYFAGGLVGVFLGFYFSGVLLAVFYRTLFEINSIGKLFLYFALFMAVTNIDNAFDGYLINLIRTAVMAAIMVFIIFSKDRKQV